jgi:uncharacterized protein VirK/YbjX
VTRQKDERASAASQWATVCRFLLRDWQSNWRRYRLSSWLLKSLRASRALLCVPEHGELCRLDVYRDYLGTARGAAFFHHLSHRYYLAKSLSLRQRVNFALMHYGVESGNFSAAYKRQIYLGPGLTIWERNIGDAHFRIGLSLGERLTAEGDLCIALFVDGQRLHSINFSWINGSVVGSESPVVPYVTRNQGRWPHDPERLQRFEKAFPHNSPRYFCLAAVQGMGRALGADRMVAVSSQLQVCGKAEDMERFAVSYDAFWESLGATPIASYGYAIPLPFYAKPLAEISTKHRKRAALRRGHWQEIEASVIAALDAYLLNPTLPPDQPVARETISPYPGTPATGAAPGAN